MFLRGFRAVLQALRRPKPLFHPPTLPPELERRIFELAATAYPECASTLVLVAHRTLIWIEPLLYHTVVLGRSRSGEVHDFLRTLRTRPPHFFATHVKTLVLTSTVDPAQAAHILSICTGVINLISSVPTPTLLPTTTTTTQLPPFLPRLRRLAVHLKSHTLAPPDFSHPSFAHLTHLELIVTPSITAWSAWPATSFAHLSALTHLALAFHGDARLGDLDVLHAILARCPALKVLLVLAHADYISLATLDLVQDSFQDPRVAFIREEPRLQDSLHGLRGERDMWSRAEDLVKVQSGTAL